MNYNPQTIEFPSVEANSIQSPIDLVLDLAAAVWRFRKIIAGCVLVFSVLTALYLINTPKQYTATAEMVIDPRQSGEFMNRRSNDAPTPQVDSAVVDSEGAVLSSESVALEVISKLHLVDDPVFRGQSSVTGSFFATVGQLIGVAPASNYERLRKTVENFDHRLSVKRVGATYVFQISFEANDPRQAAQIANAVAAAYVDTHLQAKSDVSLKAAAWMKERLAQLGTQASQAERAVADFKRDHNIVDAGGRSLDEQQVSELQSQLSIARSNKSNAKAKLDRIKQVLDSKQLDLSVADARSNEVIVNLTDKYTDLAKKEADLERRLGRNHQAPTLLRHDMAQVRASIFDELKRIGAGYQSDFQIAFSQEQGLVAALDKAKVQSANTREAQVRLNQLQSSADAYRALYDTFLQRLGEAIQQESFPVTETRVVTAATPPLKKSHPKTLLSLLVSVGAAFVVGFSIGWIREKTDRTVKTRRQVEESTKSTYITSVPNLARPSADLRLELLDRPLSTFAEAIRELRVVIELYRVDHNMQVIGFTSALPEEGKSTLITNLAALAVKSRVKVVVVDCDLRDPTISSLVPASQAGLVEVLLRQTTIAKAVQPCSNAGFDLLPVAVSLVPENSSDLLSSPEMSLLLDTLKRHYDLVLVDLPPLMSVVDTKASAKIVDGFVLVTEWGKTPVATLTEALDVSGHVKDRLIGIVLNKVDPRLVNKNRGPYFSAA